MKKIPVYIHCRYANGKDEIDCICPVSNKACEYDCEEQIIYYNEYQDIMKCFINKGKKEYNK